MKNRRFIIAALLVVAATAAFVSCKKENQDALLKDTQSVNTFTVPRVDDMYAYLRDFKQKMQTSKDDETMSLEEAAWHLSSLANIDFCRVNVEYDGFLFDTIEIQVNIKNGVMLMNDLNNAYEQMGTEIQQFKNGFNRLNQNLYFIKVYIDVVGNAKIALMTSYTANSKDLYTHPWYFQDIYDAVYTCNEYFSDDSTYFWNGLAASGLQEVLRLFEHHVNGGSSGHPQVSYIPTRDHFFDYTNTYDPYGTTYYYINDSRVFAKKSEQSNENYALGFMEMCYCLDSYLGLGYDYIDDNLYTDEHPVNWTISCHTTYSNFRYHHFHKLFVEYGQLITIVPPSPND